MKIISWNVNGLRACATKGFFDFMREESADIYCLQEIKMQKEQSTFDLTGYFEYWNSAERKGYSGTAIFSKVEPLSASYGIGIEEHDTEGRVITLEFENFYLITVYTPNSKHELLRLPYRMEWEDAFRHYVLTLEEKKPAILCGDLNVAHKEIDLKNPGSNTKNPGFTVEERDKLTKLLDSGFIDSYRHFYKDKADAYTWWSYRAGARERNVGWRIDYFLLSEKLTNILTDSFIYDQIYGSDHCPVGISIKI